MDGFEDAIEDRFELAGVIGSGAFAEVRRGIDRASGTAVAIKQLVSAAKDPTAILRFQREARLLSQIQSPHVVGYIAQGRDNLDRPSLVLEWLDGPEIGRLRKARTLPVAEAIAVARQAALGLHAIHLAGVVHRDVKPSNFVALSNVRSGIRIKLIDLGVASVPTGAKLTEEGFAVGTFSYMSPEQVRCDPTITPQSDLFSLGVTLYELLSGTRPFIARDPSALLSKILHDDPVPLRSRVPELSADLEAVVHRAIAKHPGDRFESAQKMADALILTTA